MSDPVSRTSRKVTVGMEIEIFDFPPCGDALVLSKQAPVGPKAAKKMMDTLCPNAFELVMVDDDVIEAIILKKQTLKMTDEKTLIESIVEEVRPFVSVQTILKVRCNVKISINKTL